MRHIHLDKINRQTLKTAGHEQKVYTASNIYQKTDGSKRYFVPKLKNQAYVEARRRATWNTAPSLSTQCQKRPLAWDTVEYGHYMVRISFYTYYSKIYSQQVLYLPTNIRAGRLQHRPKATFGERKESFPFLGSSHIAILKKLQNTQRKKQRARLFFHGKKAPWVINLWHSNFKAKSSLYGNN